ncbi:MAG: DUF1501 domain-containing protein [Gemmataceae bacterium]|nr:DUF1501 domain-containing protein [Gemmataceae bacterium]
MFGVRISTRREFLTGGLGLIGLGAALPNFLVRTALAAQQPPNNNTILVVVQFSGGNDGLSTVVPYASDDYGRVRRATRIAANQVLRLNDEVGLHPNLTGLKDLYDRGALAVIQGVGYPNPNQSHFTSMDIWHSADPSIQERGAGIPGREAAATSGWLGRYCDHAYRGQPDALRTVAVGFNQSPRALQGRQHGGLAVQSFGGFRFFIGNPRDRERTDVSNRLARIPPAVPAAVNGELDFVTRTITDAIAAGERINNITARYQTNIPYPFNIPLGISLRTVAAMIAGGIPARVFYVQQDGYDTHAGQRTRHDKLMGDLNAALTAFTRDLDRQGNAQRVLLMTMSEFGRRVDENGSQGTDHGTAAPLFLIGPRVRAGVHGRHPSLAAADLVAGRGGGFGRDLAFHTDFRRVYATILERWLRTQSRPVLGTQMPLLDCLA